MTGSNAVQTQNNLATVGRFHSSMVMVGLLSAVQYIDESSIHIIVKQSPVTVTLHDMFTGVSRATLCSYEADDFLATARRISASSGLSYEDALKVVAYDYAELKRAA